MKLNRVLQGNYEGYLLQGYAKSLLKISEVKEFYKKLRKIPKKISYFVKRSTIKEVYKHTNWCYFVIDTDNNVYILDY